MPPKRSSANSNGPRGSETTPGVGESKSGYEEILKALEEAMTRKEPLPSKTISGIMNMLRSADSVAVDQLSKKVTVIISKKAEESLSKFLWPVLAANLPEKVGERVDQLLSEGGSDKGTSHIRIVDVLAAAYKKIARAEEDAKRHKKDGQQREQRKRGRTGSEAGSEDLDSDESLEHGTVPQVSNQGFKDSRLLTLDYKHSQKADPMDALLAAALFRYSGVSGVMFDLLVLRFLNGTISEPAKTFFSTQFGVHRLMLDLAPSLSVNDGDRVHKFLLAPGTLSQRDLLMLRDFAAMVLVAREMEGKSLTSLPAFHRLVDIAVRSQKGKDFMSAVDQEKKQRDEAVEKRRTEERRSYQYQTQSKPYRPREGEHPSWKQEQRRPYQQTEAGPKST